MYINFNKEMRRTAEDRVPELVVRQLSKSLPEGTHYEMNSEGFLVLQSDDGMMTIDGLQLKDLEDLKKKVGEASTLADIFRYSYNAQEPLRLKPMRDGYLKINGMDVPIEKIKLDPFHEVKSLNSEIFAIPKKFPKANDIHLGNGQYNLVLHMQRIPNDNLDEVVIQSDQKKALRITMRINAKTGMTIINISIALKYAKTIRDIVESLSLYNAFIDGKATINGEIFTPSEVKAKKFNKNYICFFERVLDVETILRQKLSKAFIPPTGDIDEGDVRIIEELYQTLYLGKPVKKPVSLTSITGGESIKDETNLDDLIGEKLFFVYNSTQDIEIFGTTFIVYSLNGIFGLEVSNYENKDGKVTLFFKERDAEEGTETETFVSSMDFLNEEEMEKYQKENETTLADIFDDAISLKDVVNADFMGFSNVVEGN